MRETNQVLRKCEGAVAFILSATIILLSFFVMKSALAANDSGGQSASSQSSWNALEFIRNSESVMVCEYQSYETKGEVTYFKPPCARYRPVEWLKGPPI